MIGQGLKKLAAENGMGVSNGVAYGNLRGYAVTMFEGSGYKQIVFSTQFADPAQKEAFTQAVGKVNIQRQYRVQQLGIALRNISVVFQDTVGTMKKIRGFLDWFLPLLEQHSAAKWDICPECGAQVTNGCWKLVDGIAYYMHETCAEKVRVEIAADNENRKQEAPGSYVTGFVGAFLGAVLGAILWAIVLNAGFVASVVGLAIGWLAEKGYRLFQGKQGKGKIAILILVIIMGVMLGTFGADAIYLAGMVSEGALYTYSEIPLVITYLLANDNEYLIASLGNILMGLLFAGIGVFALLKKAGKEVADTKFIDLK